MDYRAFFAYIFSTLETRDVNEKKAEAAWIFQHFTGKSNLEIPILDGFFTDIASVDKVIKERNNGIPLAYILGYKSFYGRDFQLNKACLIPRCDSEILIENMLMKVEKTLSEIVIFDFCCGSGCLGITFAAQYILDNPSCKICLYFIDISDAALEMSLKNAEKILKNQVICKNIPMDIMNDKWDFDRKCDVFISNPPYIPSIDIDKLDNTVKDFEPKIALDGGADGLKFYRKIAENIGKVVKSDTLCGIEFGIMQEVMIKEIFQSHKLAFYKDLSHIMRCATFKIDEY
ncbi:HemK/PrmC family methyltransferase [Candidatus Deianiraea vastatrix]|uniref:peptide chain release factor N(5)-glutamine methyltransferase n=1 Tax=Candidatus Deianiraea vastatrix TaxID=2163644 RepID=A0A5B8XG28_9RICK|nr:HemK/PrmC family methyltransferase [Candidatus Deianiraea vastatrix]QED23859.1 Release factor glutamine methyltransferase [Candidatus Deianiraea vastatrix]